MTTKRPKQRQMIITVGTSLFHSASWSSDLDDVIPGYARWTEPGLRGSPSGRRFLERSGRQPSGQSLAKAIEEYLRDPDGYLSKHGVAGNDAATRTPKALFKPKWPSELLFEDVMAYSAEVATVLQLAYDDIADDEHDVSQQSAQAWAREYVKAPNIQQPAIALMCASDTNDESNLAARIIEEQLDLLFGTEGRVKVVACLPPDTIERVRTFWTMAEEYARGAFAVDYVVSGGYKVYVSVVGMALRRGLHLPSRLVYMHEQPTSSGEPGLVRATARDLEVARQSARPDR